MRIVGFILTLLLVLPSAASADENIVIDDFELPWMNHPVPGTTYSTFDHPNGIFVIEAYFINCPYCNQNVPFIKSLAADYAGEPRVQILDVGRDCRASDYQRWIQRHNPNYPVLNDCGTSVLGPLGTTGYPSTYLVDCQGRVRHQSRGLWRAEVAREFRRQIDLLLNESCHVQ